MKGDVIVCDDGRVIRDLGDVISIFIPMEIRRRSGRKQIIPPDQPEKERKPTPLQIALARAYVWQKWIDEGKYPNAGELAWAMKIDASYVRRILRLGLLCPRIVEKILQGNKPDVSLNELIKMDVPMVWAEQSL